MSLQPPKLQAAKVECRVCRDVLESYRQSRRYISARAVLYNLMTRLEPSQLESRPKVTK